MYLRSLPNAQGQPFLAPVAFHILPFCSSANFKAGTYLRSTSTFGDGHKHFLIGGLGIPCTRKVALTLSAQGNGNGMDDNQGKVGDKVLSGVNLELMRILVTGEVVVGIAAAVLALLLQVNPFLGIDFSLSTVGLGALGALPIFIAVLAAASVLALSAGVFEEALFRGVIQQVLQGPVGDIPALVIAAVLFGFAHSPVPGANAYTEACYGANFGLLYLLSGGNLAVPTVAHVVYDLLTFLEVHNRATAGIEVAMTGPQIEEKEVVQRVRRVVGDFGLSTNFVDMAFSVFKQLDLDGNNAIDQKELQLGLRTFGKFTSDEEIRVIMCQADVDRNNVLSFDEFVRLLAINYSYLLKK